VGLQTCNACESTTDDNEHLYLQRERLLSQTIAQIGAGIDMAKDPATGDEAVFTDSLCSSISSTSLSNVKSMKIVTAALELALFSALEQQEHQHQHTPAHQADSGGAFAAAEDGCNCTLRRQLADIEVEIQELLLSLGSKPEQGQLSIATSCMQRLTPARMQQLVQRPLQQCLQEAADVVEALMLCLPR
jgi:hypothetical protein